MNKKPWLAVLMLCLLLTACKDAVPAPSQTSDTKDPAYKETSQTERADEPVPLGRLTVELVVEWEETDRILSCLDQLSGLLSDSLLAQGYAAEGVTVTISTAGGITGSALAEGGIDAACMPGVDYVEYEEHAAAVLVTDGEAGAGVVAVTSVREELDEAFRGALASALLGPGAQFLELCYPGAVYVPASEEALQAVHNQAAGQMEAARGA